MAVYKYEDVAVSSIPHTKMQRMLIDGVCRALVITPLSGYVLRDKANDVREINMERLEPTGRILFSYASGCCTCGSDYSFAPVEVTDENGVHYTAYGSREFFASSVNAVDPERIFGMQVCGAEDADG